MVKKFTHLILALILAGMAACSKSAPEVGNSSTGLAPTASVESASCGDTSSAALVKSIEEKEAKKSELEIEAKKSPSKESFRKLFDAEIAFGKETERTLHLLSNCEVPVPESMLNAVKKKISSSRESVNYLVENFPDFK